MIDINSQLVEVIFNISRLMKGQTSSQGELSKLSFLQIQTLIFVAKNTKTQMTDVANNFNIELPSATSLVQNLVKAGLLGRKADTQDRRIVRVVMTAKGRKLLKTAMKEREKRIASHVSLLTEVEKKQLLTILNKMIVKMEEENEK